MKFILIILTTFLFACNNKPKEIPQSIPVEKKIENEVSTSTKIPPFKIINSSSTLPVWISNLYNKTEETDYYKITHEVIQFNIINDSLSSCIINSNDGICAKYFLATQLSKKEIDFIELAEDCDHEQSIPEHSWSEYKIINSKKVNTTEYNEFIPDSLLIDGEIPIGKGLEDFEFIRSVKNFEFNILKNGNIEKSELISINQKQLIKLDSLNMFSVDDYPITNDMFIGNYDKIVSGDLLVYDQVWFSNDILEQTLIFELYTDYHRIATYHFLNTDTPKDLIRQLSFQDNKGNSVTELQIKNDFIGFLNQAIKIDKEYFISNKKFQFGDNKEKAIKIYGKPDVINSENGMLILKWSFDGDYLFDELLNVKKKQIAKESFGHEITMYFKQNKLIGQILFNDIP